MNFFFTLQGSCFLLDMLHLKKFQNTLILAFDEANGSTYLNCTFFNFGILWAKILYLLKFCTWVMVTIILFKRIFAAIGIFHCANMILNIHSTMQCTKLKLYFVRTLFQFLQLIWEPPSHSISLLGIFTFCCRWEYIYFDCYFSNVSKFLENTLMKL